METCLKWSKIHKIDIIGIDNFILNEDYYNCSRIPIDLIIIRLKNKPKNTLLSKYLIVIEDSEIIINHKLPIFDIFILKNFQYYKLKLKHLKKLNRKNIGIEIKLKDIRNCNSEEVGKWVKCIKDVHKFCKLTNNQLILSSGAENECETISRNTFDAILKIIEIEPLRYWNDLEKWLNVKSRVYYGTTEKG